jgi:hypothetical protein
MLEYRTWSRKPNRIRRPRKKSEPNPSDERLLNVLAASDAPIQSAEFARRLGMFRKDAMRACRWLLKHGYVARSYRLVTDEMRPRIQRYPMVHKRRVTCWTLTAKAVQYRTERECQKVREGAGTGQP